MKEVQIGVKTQCRFQTIEITIFLTMLILTAGQDVV